MFFTYILKSDKNNKHYIGHTQDLEQRLHAHNKGKTKSTKHGIPWKVIYFERFETRALAVQRELFFKSYDGRIFLKTNNIL